MPHAIQVDPPFFPSQQGLWHGGDWNPDQWLDQPAVLDEDLRLMAAAHCRVFSLGYTFGKQGKGVRSYAVDYSGSSPPRRQGHRQNRQAISDTHGRTPSFTERLPREFV